MNRTYKVDEFIEFQRVDDEPACCQKGTVRISITDAFDKEKKLCFEIPPNLWASLVLTMSAYNERPNDWHALIAHHQGQADLMDAAKTLQSIQRVIAS